MKTKSHQALLKAIDLAGSQVGLARLIGKRQGHISQWLKAGRVSPEGVLPVAQAVEWKITPHELRDDLYPHPDDGLPEHLRGQSGNWPDGLEQPKQAA